MVGEFELTDMGAGHFALRGEMSFHSAEQILRKSQKLFDGQSSIEIDLSGVKETDSAGLALLLEWISRAGDTKQEICFVGIPEKVLAIAQTTEVDDLIRRYYSSSSKK